MVDGHSTAHSTAVLVHGAWGNPTDWKFVERLLVDRDVTVVVPDLPSHQSTSAARANDVATVEAAIAAAAPPVVLVGWSYGGGIVSDVTHDLDRVGRLVYVASVPKPLPDAAVDGPPSHPPDLSHILFPDDASCVLDDGWWLTDGDATTLPTDVIAHLHEHRRRPIALEAMLAPPVAEAWRTVPTTVLLGLTDNTIGPEMRSWATSHLDDVRLVDSDHFILWRTPEVIADVVLEPRAR
jgi:pimeloyl-ACP methyl ester carboxylesterase